jgi:hypothetical protein
MDLSQAQLLRDVLEGTGLLEETDEFARALRSSTRLANGLLIAGPANDEPWHLTAHLDDEARHSGNEQLRPTLLRWDIHPGDPAHLSIGMERLADARRGESVLVVNETAADAELTPLLERIADARRRGAAVFALQDSASELSGVASETITLADYPRGLLTFDNSQHLVSLAVGRDHVAEGRRGLRARLGRLLDAWTGPAS